MINKIMKFLAPIIVIITIFFVNTIDVKAGYETYIKCEYVLPLNYYHGSITASYDEILITYTRDDGETSIKYVNTLNNKENKKFVEDSFDEYIIGNKGDGTEEKRGENHRTCPSWIKYWINGANDHIEPVSKDTFYVSGDHENKAGTYVNFLKVSNGDFKVSKESTDFSLHSVERALSPYYLFLKKESIDRRETEKGKKVAKEYFETLYFDNNTENILTYYDSSSFNKNYIDLTNYSFETYDEFKAYALSGSIGNEEYDSNISMAEWEERWEFFYLLQEWTDFAYYLQNSYGEIFNENYTNEVYTKMIQYSRLPREKKVTEKLEEIEDRENNNDYYNKNICTAVCANEDGTINSGYISACQAYNTEYINCNNCLKDKCKYVPSNDFDACMKGCYGEDKYNVLLGIKETNQEKLEELKDRLYNVKAPSLDIGFDPDGYKVQCEDVEMLHFIYAAMRIIAPILVIVFGMLDYTKSVFAADEQKILEARKKFPKRLILLILFILVPLIIDLILGIFGPDTSLMKCIISG